MILLTITFRAATLFVHHTVRNSLSNTGYFERRSVAARDVTTATASTFHTGITLDLHTVRMSSALKCGSSRIKRIVVPRIWNLSPRSNRTASRGGSKLQYQTANAFVTSPPERLTALKSLSSSRYECTCDHINLSRTVRIRQGSKAFCCLGSSADQKWLASQVISEVILIYRPKTCFLFRSSY
jgi:hypothetical protein